MKLFALLAAGAAAALLGLPFAAAAAPLGRVTVTQVEINEDSARVYYLPVPGAKDYRIYALDNPKEVKYAGIGHYIASYRYHWAVDAGGAPLFPYQMLYNQDDKPGLERFDAPLLDIEYNGLDPHVTSQLVVEAVDHVGPAPYSNLASEENIRLHEAAQASAASKAVRARAGAATVRAASKASSSSSASAMSMSMSMSADDDAMELIGSNSGPTDDGLYSINGQSGPHVRPAAIARSLPVLVRPTGVRALPSTPSATEVVFDTFGQGDIEEIPGTRDNVKGTVSYVMHSDAAWRIDFREADILHSRPFIMNRHYMDVLFDGGTPGTNNPLHVSHGASTMTPVRTADFSGGRMLHATMEVDAHVDDRRWMAFNIVPYDDPLTNLYFDNAAINKSNTGLFFQIFSDHDAVNLLVGPKDTPLLGALGQAPLSTSRAQLDGYNGMGLDNRSRFDIFLTRSRYLIYENGALTAQQSFPAPLPLSLQHVKVYYTHYLYHSSNEVIAVKSYTPWEGVWGNLFPYSDERHWDNMGFEVLPASYASADADTLAKLITQGQSVRVEQAVNLMASR